MNIENIETHNIVFIRLPTKANMKKKKKKEVQFNMGFYTILKLYMRSEMI